MKFRKKPVIIEAFQWDGTIEQIQQANKEYIPKWATKAYNDGVIYFDEDGNLWAKTLEGDMKATEETYVLRGVEGEIYFCEQRIFNKTYEVVK